MHAFHAPGYTTEEKQEEKERLTDMYTLEKFVNVTVSPEGDRLSDLTLSPTASYHSLQGQLHLLIPQSVDDGVDKRSDGCGE